MLYPSQLVWLGRKYRLATAPLSGYGAAGPDLTGRTRCTNRLRSTDGRRALNAVLRRIPATRLQRLAESLPKPLPCPENLGRCANTEAVARPISRWPRSLERVACQSVTIAGPTGRSQHVSDMSSRSDDRPELADISGCCFKAGIGRWCSNHNGPASGCHLPRKMDCGRRGVVPGQIMC